MRATALEVTETSALVELRPSWLARLLGARIERVRLVWIDEDTYTMRAAGWHSATSRRPLGALDHGALILRALEFRPVGQLPRATATARAT